MIRTMPRIIKWAESAHSWEATIANEDALVAVKYPYDQEELALSQVEEDSDSLGHASTRRSARSRGTRHQEFR